MVASLLSVVALVQLVKCVSRYRADEKVLRVLPPIDPSALNLTYDYQIFSCMVDGVYARDDGRGDSVSAEYFYAAGYEEVTDPDTLLEYDENRRATTRSTLVRDMFINPVLQAQICLFKIKDQKRKMKDPVLNTMVERPMFVFLIRGTILSCRDLVDDWSIICERLHIDVGNYVPIVNLIVELCEIHPSQVAVVGHSLGAALALLVARDLALAHRILVAAYLFNLPNATGDVIVKKIFTGAVNGLSDVARFALGNRARGTMRDLGDRVSSSASTITRAVTQRHLGVKLEKLERDGQILQNIGFRPRIFTNRRDTISNEYSSIYATPGQEVPVISTSAPILRKLRVNALSHHLVRAGFLFINDWAKGVKEAHSISQWYGRDSEVTVNRFGCE